MKFSTALMLLAILSCGKYTVSGDSSLSTFKSMAPVIVAPGSRDFNDIQAICEAIQAKTTTIEALVSTAFSFTGTAKNCTDSSFSELPDSIVILTKELGSYKFSEGNSLFYFSDVETSTEGILSQICAKLPNLASPISVDSNNLLYFSTTDISTSDCLAGNNEICIKIEKAIKSPTSKGDMGRIHTREWMSVKVVQPRRGFFTYRKRISEASCTEGNFIGRTATLK